ncbi:MAG: hypothetical protein NZ699_01780 [Roseiflexus sp.]|nr:hypothetical protein [Roseiflexus sp.]MCS7287841.1 hypothetical protein [Roseiflexus sp.]MDW8147019.1 hypothetical protein [Roseiflexaceae bacterium]MDW8233475.1 hypothetical protein [Roseiflexaceae bacterium]
MSDNELRAAIPQRIVRGAILRSDGRAVGLVGGGAPAWDLRSRESRARLAETYHRILLAQDSPVDIYIVDGPPDLERELTELYRRSSQSAHPTLTAILDEIAEYLEECASATVSRHRQTIWAVAGREPSALPASARNWLSGSFRSANGAVPLIRDTPLLAEAVERARRLADALASLGGTPPPRLLEAEEIARLWFRLIDPVRASRYPLQGALLERIRLIVNASR